MPVNISVYLWFIIAVKWLTYMGNQSLNTLVPFPINFTISNDPYNATTSFGEEVTLTPMNGNTDNCSNSCSCQDCQSACGAPLPPPQPPTPWLILGIDGLSFIMWCVYCVFVIGFGTYLVWNCLGYVGNQEELGDLETNLNINSDLNDSGKSGVCRGCSCFAKIGKVQFYIKMLTIIIIQII